MNEEQSFPVGDVSRVANTFIEKVSSAIGAVCQPWHIRRVAHAQADAAVLLANADVIADDIRARAERRRREEDLIWQRNIESVAEGAIPLLESSGHPENIDSDWVANFFDKVRIVSDAEMQKVWTAVLAGEANAPGAFSRQTINTLANMEKDDAVQFMALCRCGWMIGDFVPVVFETSHSAYTQIGLSFVVIAHLASLGLCSFNEVGTYQRQNLPSSWEGSYFGQRFRFATKGQTTTLDIGHVLLTRPGHQIARAIRSTPAIPVMDYAISQWTEKGIIVERIA